MSEEALNRIAAALARIADRMDQLQRPTLLGGHALRYRGKPIADLNSGEYMQMWQDLRAVGLLAETEEDRR